MDSFCHAAYCRQDDKIFTVILSGWNNSAGKRALLFFIALPQPGNIVFFVEKLSFGGFHRVNFGGHYIGIFMPQKWIYALHGMSAFSLGRSDRQSDRQAAIWLRYRLALRRDLYKSGGYLALRRMFDDSFFLHCRTPPARSRSLLTRLFVLTN